ncbi:hypothetical protein [Corynebacterium glyciniphilum]|uniref:hypothetical protein n=1 Tax=Corynebacterium glyciniphilum TaxID=1404244 RepID=UPI003FCFE7AF
MAENRPVTRTSNPSSFDYASLARWAKSHAGRNALAVALSQPTTPAEKALADEHDAVLRRVLADYRDDSGQGQTGGDYQRLTPPPDGVRCLSPTATYDRNGSRTAQNFSHATDGNSRPSTSQPQPARMADRSCTVSATTIETTATTRSVASELLGAITEARHALLDKLVRT